MNCGSGRGNLIIARDLHHLIYFPRCFLTCPPGLATEDSYPYTATDGVCKSVPSVAGSAVRSYVDISPTDSALTNAVARQPVSVAIEADQRSFQMYSSGVFTGACGTNLDHGVLAVG